MSWFLYLTHYASFVIAFSDWILLQVTTFNISLVVHGTIAEYNDYQKVPCDYYWLEFLVEYVTIIYCLSLIIFSDDIIDLQEAENPYAVPVSMGILKILESPLDITTSTIIRRIVSNHDAYLVFHFLLLEVYLKGFIKIPNILLPITYFCYISWTVIDHRKHNCRRSTLAHQSFDATIITFYDLQQSSGLYDIYLWLIVQTRNRAHVLNSIFLFIFSETKREEGREREAVLWGKDIHLWRLDYLEYVRYVLEFWL